MDRVPTRYAAEPLWGRYGCVMRRRTFKILAGFSLVLSVLAAGAILRSFFVLNIVEHFTPGATVGGVLHRSRLRLYVGRGVLYCTAIQEADAPTSPAEMADLRPGFESIPPWIYTKLPASWSSKARHQVLGFGYSDEGAGPARGWSDTFQELRVPLWLPLTLFVGVPVILMARERKRKRSTRAGLCLACGYDLRATPDRCPESGAVPALTKIPS